MKAAYFTAAGALALTFGIAACVAGPDMPEPGATPTPAPVARPAPPPAPTPPPIVREPVFENYLDAPQTPGIWRYADERDESFAMFMSTETAGPAFMVRCAGGQIALARFTRGPSRLPLAMEVQTETTSRSLSASPIEGRPIVAATLSAQDSLLDAMAITKGRIAIGVEGEHTLYLPAWAEITRVIEDCR
ncbi:hypothetical protein MWU38_01710 [Qipengyuania sp. S6317L1]|uniref:hypothetical protein n=1 Tax=Qipengyuania sp. S6317L1 TaxID=2926410 RepID=UPI001FF54582|nr:hypothetical protein [Qipengyuania sp. S6317L1]MCK0098087.1 hypothetical protein [Qipengyuania sp. S6317L1]